jgi:hypothetical protein
MDIATQLALMAKAKKVFGNSQTFLSFPLTPLPYRPQQLNFLEDKNLDNLQKFSMLVNQIPSGETWQPIDGFHLWDVYNSILNEAHYAESTRTPDEEAAYQRANRVLFTMRDDGMPIETPIVTAYRQYKDAYIVAEEAYASAKSTALYLTDPIEKQRWQDIEEPRLRNQLNDRLNQWNLQGFKNEVEAALATRQSLGARSPYQTLSEWKKLWMKEIDTITSAVDQSSAPSSSFAPSNALAEGAWQSFSLTEAEINALIAEAPADLRTRLGVTTTSFESMTFEASSATIVRPWFTSDALKSKFWRFADNRMLSDGNVPAIGDCPAYVTAVVFARKLAGIPKPQPQPQPQPIIPRPIQPKLKIDREILEEVGPRGKQIFIPRDRLRMSAMKPMIMKNLGESAPIVNAEVLQLRREHLFTRLEEVTFDRLPAVIDPAIQPKVKSQDQTKAQPLVDDSIYILAFICKRLSKCPDPDLTLKWD